MLIPLGYSESTSPLTPQAKLSQKQITILSGALSLHGEIPELGLTYQICLERAKSLGLTHIALVVQGHSADIYASSIDLDGPHSTSLSTVRSVAKQAKQLGLGVIIFPIIWLNKRGDGEWRGALNPTHVDRWWSSYEAWISRLAELATEVDASLLSVGSELSSMEASEGRWRSLIRRVRTQFSGSLIYSSNWDHYDGVQFWDELDFIGLTAYYPLTEEEGPKTLEVMKNRWSMIRVALLDWLGGLSINRGIFFTELGYPSQVGGSTRPWHYLQSTQVDLDLQKTAFQAFRITWGDEQRLHGINLWNMWGLGGPQDAWYTLWGKPAAQEARALIQVLSNRSRR